MKRELRGAWLKFGQVENVFLWALGPRPPGMCGNGPLDQVPALRRALPHWVQPQEYLRGTEGSVDSYTGTVGVNQDRPGQSQSLVTARFGRSDFSNISCLHPRSFTVLQPPRVLHGSPCKALLLAGPSAAGALWPGLAAWSFCCVQLVHLLLQEASLTALGTPCCL